MRTASLRVRLRFISLWAARFSCALRAGLRSCTTRSMKTSGYQRATTKCAASGSSIRSAAAAVKGRCAMGWTKHGVERVKILTAEQEQQIPVFAEKWDRIARSTEPWDRRAATSGIKQFYKTIGARAPKRVRGFNSLAEAWNAAQYVIGKWDSDSYKRFRAKHPNF